MNDGQPALSGQLHRVPIQKRLCWLAILMFAGYIWSRGLHWSTETISHVEVNGSKGFVVVKDATYEFAGTEWDSLGSAVWIYGLLMVVPNLLYIFAHQLIDQLVPAVANTGIGVLLTTLTAWFVIDPTGAMGSATRRGNLTFEWVLGPGAWPALGFAIVILLVGLFQGYLRHRAVLEDAA